MDLGLFCLILAAPLLLIGNLSPTESEELIAVKGTVESVRRKGPRRHQSAQIRIAIQTHSGPAELIVRDTERNRKALSPLGPGVEVDALAEQDVLRRAIFNVRELRVDEGTLIAFDAGRARVGASRAAASGYALLVLGAVALAVGWFRRHRLAGRRS